MSCISYKDFIRFKNSIPDYIKEIVYPYIEYLVENIEQENEEDEKLKVLRDYFFIRYYNAIGYLGIEGDSSEDSSYFRYKLKIQRKINSDLAKLAKKVSEIILSNFPSPSDDFKKENADMIKKVINIFLLENDVEKAEDIENKYISDNIDDIYKLHRLSAFMWCYINKKKY